MIPHQFTARIGLLAKKVAQLRGGGSALPGLIVEKIEPDFLSRVFDKLPHGVVVISGTNGKTTTTKMVVELLQASGLRVFTNRSGSNFTRGVIASLLDQLGPDGTLDADIAVVELDEAHATHFIRQVPPTYSLLLNIMRDQLDRFGEIDHTASLLRKVASATTRAVVLNSNDPLVAALSSDVTKDVATYYFGLDISLQKLFPSDHELHGLTPKKEGSVIINNYATLTSLKGREVTFTINKHETKPITLEVNGAYNALNAAAAVCLARVILGSSADTPLILDTISRVSPAFGRGETIDIDGEPLEIVLIKNPAGFRLALDSYAGQPAATMIAINDNYADGRDMSWLWDVNFHSLDKVTVVSGVRAYDMALRLQYDDIEIRHVGPSLPEAVKQLLSEKGPKRIYCTYTAMLAIRRILARDYSLEDIQP